MMVNMVYNKQEFEVKEADNKRYIEYSESDADGEKKELTIIDDEDQLEELIKSNSVANCVFDMEVKLEGKEFESKIDCSGSIFLQESGFKESIFSAGGELF